MNLSVRLTKPGLFITATDTGVGKTALAAAIARRLHHQGVRVGVCKPIASGCRESGRELISEDAELLAAAIDHRMPLDVVNPVRYRRPMAPAAAIEEGEPPIDWKSLDRSLVKLDSQSDLLLIEGVGGLLVPLDRRTTLLDLARRLGYPMLVVTRPGLGTLNHTAMTCTLIRQAGLPLAGIVINRMLADDPEGVQRTNLEWLRIQNGAPILATIPDDPTLEALDRAVESVVWRRVAGKSASLRDSR